MIEAFGTNTGLVQVDQLEEAPSLQVLMGSYTQCHLQYLQAENNRLPIVNLASD